MANGTTSNISPLKPGGVGVQLPLTLQEKVLAYLEDDADTLKNCTLVSKAWLSMARKHLFYSVEVEERTISGFLDLIRTVPAIQHYCRHMSTTSTSIKDLAELIELLPCLEDLECLRTLHVDGAPPQHLSDLVMAIASLENLQLLTLNGFDSLQDFSCNLPVRAPGLRSLQFLTVRGRGMDQLNYWLFDAVAVAKTRQTVAEPVPPLLCLTVTITVEDLKNNDLRCLGRLMRQTARRLEHLTIEWPYSKLKQNYSPLKLTSRPLGHACLSECKNLQTLEFHHHWPNVYAWTNSAVFLEHIATNAPLRHVTLTVEFVTPVDWTEPASDKPEKRLRTRELDYASYETPLARLDSVLSKLRTLKSFAVRFKHRIVAKKELQFFEWIRARFPLTEASRIRVGWDVVVKREKPKSVIRSPSPPQTCVLDVHEIIIDYLHDDIESLRACSLVCEAWVSMSRRHLFNNVEVKSNYAALRFLALLRTVPDMNAYCKHLMVKTANIQTVADILQYLPDLEELRCHELRLDLKPLEGSMRNFVQAMLLLGNLQVLHLRASTRPLLSCSRVSPSLGRTIGLRSLVSFNALCERGPYSTYDHFEKVMFQAVALAKGNTDHPVFCYLRQLTLTVGLRDIREDGLAQMGNLMHSVARKLETLTVYWPYGPDGERECEIVVTPALQRNFGLTLFEELCALEFRHIWPHSPGWATSVAFLALLPPSVPLVMFTLTIDFSPACPLTGIKDDALEHEILKHGGVLERLDRVLSNLPHLRRVRIVFEGPSWLREDKHFVDWLSACFKLPLLEANASIDIDLKFIRPNVDMYM